MHHCLRAFWGYHLLVDGQTCPVAQDPQRNHTDIGSGSRPWFPQVVSPICDMAEADTVVMHVSATLDRIHAIDQTNQQFGAVLWVHLTTPIPADIHKKEKVRGIVAILSVSGVFLLGESIHLCTKYGRQREFWICTNFLWRDRGWEALSPSLELCWQFRWGLWTGRLSFWLPRFYGEYAYPVLQQRPADDFAHIWQLLSLLQKGPVRDSKCMVQRANAHMEDEVPKKKIEEPGISRHFLNVTLTMNRIPNYYFTNIIKPTCIITTLSACSLFMPDKDLANRLSATLTLLLTAVAYKYLVAQMVPPIGYSTALDKYVMICFTFSVLWLQRTAWHLNSTIFLSTKPRYVAFFCCVWAIQS